MTTTLVVDGYNAINAIPETQKKLKVSLKSARSAILAISKEYARSSGYITEVRVVFDGSDKNRRKEARGIPHGKTLVFSDTGKGDEKIIETVKKCSRYGRVVLASNDNYVRNNARAYNAKIISSEDLTLRKKREKPSKSSGKKIDKSLQDEITREYKEKLGL